MSTLRFGRTLTLSILFLALTTAAPLQGQGSLAPVTAPDATLYTSYFSGSGYQNISWIVCGSTATTEGCYDSGSLGPFGMAGAMIEGNPSVNLKTSTVTRSIYVVDIASGSGGTGVTLYVYKKTDTVSSSFDTTTVKLTNTVSLPLTGGSSARCSMAANPGFLFIGTDQSPSAVRVQKSNMSMAEFGGFSPPINVTAITSDSYGYVAVAFGSGTDTGNIEFAPNGNSVGDGGGAWFMLNTVLGVATSSLPASEYVPAERLVVRPKQAQKQSGHTEQHF